MTDELTICGGTGFVGRHLVRALSHDPTARVRVLVHRHDLGGPVAPNITATSADLMNPASLGALLTEGCTVVNLAYMQARSRDDNLAAVTNLVEVCRTAKVRRVVHVSTATVVGATPDNVITESTSPDPRTDYERIKLEIERLLTEGAQDAFELVILRPTAVFGPQGKNLVKLAGSLMRRSALSNYARSCLHGRRRMNLVCIENVIAAIRFAIKTAVTAGGQTFLVSDDDDELNNYRDVELTLMKRFGFDGYFVPPLAVPRVLLGALLRLGGRSNSNPNRMYLSAKLRDAGFKKAVPFPVGLALFADWYRQTYASSADSAR